MFCSGLKGNFWTLESSNYLLAVPRVCYQRAKTFSLQSAAEHSCFAGQTWVTTYHLKQTLLTQPILTGTVLPSTSRQQFRFSGSALHLRARSHKAYSMTTRYTRRPSTPALNSCSKSVRFEPRPELWLN